MKNSVVFADFDGKTGIRCKDGKYRKRPCFGTYPDCVQFFTTRGAKRVTSNLHNGFSLARKTLIVCFVENVNITSDGIEVTTNNMVYLVKDGLNYTLKDRELCRV